MTLLPMVSTSIRWLPWGVAAFERARAEGKPVLLSLGARWSAACRQMDETTFADPAVIAAIDGAFVPVRVDADRRPDISDRYTLGGWPTTAFLTPDGAILGGGTYIAPERMPSVLERVRAAFDPRRAGAPAPLASTAHGSVCCESEIVGRVFESYDERHGGFAGEPKFPLAAPVRLALAAWADTGDERARAMVLTTLDAMGWGEIYDAEEGGFFRCAATRDWRQPSPEKLLETNAAMLALYVEAATVLGVSRFADRAGDILRFTQAWLSDGDGGWFASRGETVDRTLFSDANAAMVSAALRAAALFDDEGLKEYAIGSLERVLLAAYRPGDGVAHYHDGRPHVRGLLADQIAMSAAALDAHEATGNIVYEMMAEELAHYAVRALWDGAGGGFFDRVATDEEEPGAGGRIGLLGEPLKPFVTNCEAASVLARLARASGEGEFAERARLTLEAVAPDADRHGPLAAHYLLARRELRRR